MLSRRIHLLIAILLGTCAGVVSGQTNTVTLQLFPYTGEVRISNDNPTAFDFAFYSLTSPSGALNGSNGVWNSIADTYDASGNGFIDMSHEWIELTPDATAGATNLSEGAFFGDPGGQLPANRSLSLGRIWNPTSLVSSDVTPIIRHSDGSDAIVNVRLAIDGDYHRDGNVDEIDYLNWKTYFGSTMANFADGNLDGIVNSADYTIWRNNLGGSLPGVGSGEVSALGGGSLSAAMVPEPASSSLVLMTAGVLLAHSVAQRRRSAS